MSVSLPFHFHSQAFTSTLHKHDRNESSLFNVWLVLLTAAFFFLVLSWYNFVLSAYYFLTNNTAFLTNTSHEHKTLKDQMLGTFFFALIWTTIAIIAYFTLSDLGWLEISPGAKDYWQSHPILRSEASRGASIK